MPELARWPQGLPNPNQEGYALQHVDSMQRTPLASGRARQRRRFTKTPTLMTVSWTFTDDAQAQLFEAWYRAPHREDDPTKGGINDGTDWFEALIWTPLGFRHYRARFTGMYDGPHYVAVGVSRVYAELETYERHTLPPEDVEFPDEILYGSLFDLTMNKHWPKP